ncbi:acyl transferase/acyl hydrolase/lysophospholipase [Dipodascopsis tothii]|uniref:acyl transferase/acyl hydrolase/lysophospholipase n=1 Tax=Dipodascopsis tothii TaxID=44089 RepID=UPI0034CD0D89
MATTAIFRRLARPCRGRAASTAVRPRAAVFFPGQGSQAPGMLAPWAAAHPQATRDVVDAISRALDDAALVRLLTDGGADADMQRTSNAQPAILATSVLIARVLAQEHGVAVARSHFDYVLGHSLGEITGFVAAGVLTLEDGLRVVRRRGQAMEAAVAAWYAGRGLAAPAAGAAPPHELGMAALVVPRDRLEPVMTAISRFQQAEFLAMLPAPTAPPVDRVVELANINSSAQVVLSGTRAGIAHLAGELGLRAVRLNVAAPFHSSVLLPAAQDLFDVVAVSGPDAVPFAEYAPAATGVQIVSNTTARPFASTADIRQSIVDGCTLPVNWYGSIRHLVDACGVTRFLAIGPGRATATLVAREVGAAADVVFAADPAGLAAAAAALRVAS